MSSNTVAATARTLVPAWIAEILDSAIPVLALRTRYTDVTPADNATVLVPPKQYVAVPACAVAVGEMPRPRAKQGVRSGALAEPVGLALLRRRYWRGTQAWLQRLAQCHRDERCVKNHDQSGAGSTHAFARRE